MFEGRVSWFGQFCSWNGEVLPLVLQHGVAELRAARGCGIVSVSLRQEGNVCVFSSRINSAGQSEKQQAFSAERFSADEGFCFPGLDSDDQWNQPDRLFFSVLAAACVTLCTVFRFSPVVGRRLYEFYLAPSGTGGGWLLSELLKIWCSSTFLSFQFIFTTNHR